MRQLCFGELTLCFWREPRVAPEVDHLLDAIDTIDCQDRKDAKVNDQHDPIEGIELVERANVCGGRLCIYIRGALPNGPGVAGFV